MRKILKKLRKAGFEVEKRSRGLMIKGRDGGPNRITHYSEKAIHPLRRWLKKEYGIDI
jgi:5-enolpyruvylshikimate-3-phosphate synthase|tara:strand:+ start:343 stop:516 length:174 start_codon:yes stop_codon:yes gene_type:complete